MWIFNRAACPLVYCPARHSSSVLLVFSKIEGGREGGRKGETEGKGWRDGEERERETETERHRERQRERQIGIEIDVEIERKKGRERWRVCVRERFPIYCSDVFCSEWYRNEKLQLHTASPYYLLRVCKTDTYLFSPASLLWNNGLQNGSQAAQICREVDSSLTSIPGPLSAKCLLDFLRESSIYGSNSNVYAWYRNSFGTPVGIDAAGRALYRGFAHVICSGNSYIRCLAQVVTPCCYVMQFVICNFYCLRIPQRLSPIEGVSKLSIIPNL